MSVLISQLNYSMYNYSTTYNLIRNYNFDHNTNVHLELI